MLNKIIIMGRLTRDPELRRTQSGTAVASFALAVDRDYKDQATGERGVDFIDCVAWSHTGEFASRYFSKGRMAVVQGRLQLRDWTDRDGNKRRSAEVVVEQMYFGDSKRDEGGTRATGYQPPCHRAGGRNAGTGGRRWRSSLLSRKSGAGISGVRTPVRGAKNPRALGPTARSGRTGSGGIGPGCGGNI